MLYSALTNLPSIGNPYPTARQAGGRPISLEEMESDTLQAAHEMQRKQEQQAEVNSGGNSSHQTRSRATYAKDAPMPPGLLNISCRLADAVFLGRQVPLPVCCLSLLPWQSSALLSKSCSHGLSGDSAAANDKQDPAVLIHLNHNALYTCISGITLHLLSSAMASL